MSRRTSIIEDAMRIPTSSQSGSSKIDDLSFMPVFIRKLEVFGKKGPSSVQVPPISITTDKKVL